MPDAFPCFLVTKEDEQVTAGVRSLSVEDLPPGDALVRVEYSSLNYKDALAATGHPGVVKRFPHVPGIDLAGVVEASDDERFHPGDEVLATGYDLGAGRWGGYARYARVPTDWIVPLPAGLSLEESMIFGTAGFTAALGVQLLFEHGVEPDSGEVAVTGASGGVGSCAVAILAKLGYRVAAVTGKPEAHELLQSLGAQTILARDDVHDTSARPLLSARWAGAVDTVGGTILATLLRSTQPHGCVTACGLVGGAELPLTVYPFILRGVVLAGIDSALSPMPRRETLWRQLAGEWKPEGLESLATFVSLEELPEKFEAILAGRVIGRVVVRMG